MSNASSEDTVEVTSTRRRGHRCVVWFQLGGSAGQKHAPLLAPAVWWCNALTVVPCPFQGH